GKPPVVASHRAYPPRGPRREPDTGALPRDLRDVQPVDAPDRPRALRPSPLVGRQRRHPRGAGRRLALAPRPPRPRRDREPTRDELSGRRVSALNGASAAPTPAGSHTTGSGVAAGPAGHRARSAAAPP